MNNYRINLNYAKALFMLATDRNSVEAVAEDMRMVEQVCAENRELTVVLANPMIAQTKKISIIEDIFSSSVSEETMAFMRFVVKKNRSVNLKGISTAFMELYRESKGIVLASLVTHQPTDEQANLTVEKLVSEYTGKEVELLKNTDSNMLGGFVLRFDNNMYDARIRTKIRKLRNEFARNDYENKL